MSTNAPTLQSLLDGLHRLKEDENEMTIGIIITLLGVALYGTNEKYTDDRVSIRELSVKIGLPYTTVSRHIQFLSDMERPGRPGMGCVASAELPTDRRQKYVWLTPKGNRLISQFKSIAHIG